MDSFFDPSKTGRFENTAITIPILRRIDVIERGDDLWGDTSAPTVEDLLPSDLTYRLIPGDVVVIEIYGLYTPGQWYPIQLRLDATGEIRLPELGNIKVAGMTVQELEDQVKEMLLKDVLVNPLVNASIAEAGGFRYTIYGAVPQPGVFTLRSPDLRLLDALALAGGAPISIKNIYVIRSITLSDTVTPGYKQQPPGAAGGVAPGAGEERNIEDLIRDLDRDKNNTRGTRDDVSPGAFSQDQDATALVDVDDLSPIGRSGSRSASVDTNQDRPFARPSVQPTFFYDQQRGEWVRVPGTGIVAQHEMPRDEQPRDLMIERIIRVDYGPLLRGDSSQNLVVRPGDRIYVEVPETGVVYIDGEIARRGVYNINATTELTLSRLVAAAGGLSGVAVPERVDLTRRVGTNREATIRLDLAAIRNRTQPDVLIKPDDVVIIGTSWIATPIAVARSGFRVTYGFGFLLDRNFGTDVFGAPPRSNQ